ncbi:Hypothetical protein PBC10988_36790 [Planctomycetales bacterium 10988]|nr:Hypothetical protein PBC10988_36790 [Planctomycetales bacterium 10988]
MMTFRIYRSSPLRLPLFFIGVLLLVFAHHAALLAKPPNVLFIAVDDMNWRLGCYGNELAVTPHLDRLAARGVRFERAYCNFPVCGASRTSFLSGRYPTTTGVLRNGEDPRQVLGEDYSFLPEYFREHGYFTVGLGKLLHTPEHLDTITWDFYRDPQWQPEDVFKSAENAKETRAWPPEQHPDGISARLAVKYLEEERDKPLFLAVGFHRPHAPRAAPGKYWDQIDPEKFPLPEAGKITPGIPEIAYPPKFEPNYPEEKIRSTLHAYHVTSTFIDDQVGLLLDALDRNNLWENTIVVLFSDHGVHLGEHGGFWNKTSLMEEAIKVPLLMYLPGGAAGEATRESVGLIDLFPTLTEACGLPPQEGVEGESLVPFFKDPASEREKSEVFSMVLRKEHNDTLGYSVRTRRWGYAEWPDGSRQLYDHLKDPGEMMNLSGQKEYAKIETRLANKLEHHRKRTPLREVPEEKTPDSSELTLQDDPASVPEIFRKGGGFEPDQVDLFKQAGGLALKLDVFYPQGWKQDDSRPAALFFFGGGWRNGDTRQFYPQSEYLTTRGMVAICAQYRTASSGGATPTECVEDAKSAVRYVRKHAAKYGIDPNKLAVGGGSAGGHVAAATATLDKYNSPDDDLSVSPVPNALLLYNPACDNSPEGYGYDRVKDEFPSISPMENLEGKVPPTIIFLGDRDGVFPVDRAKLYQQRMQENGNRCELLIYPDQVHGFFRLDRSKQGLDREKNKKYFLETTEALDRFLVSLGYLSGEPTARAWLAAQELKGQKQSSHFKRSDQPNIIVIFADDLGYEDLGVQGSPDAKTPFIDSLATNGVRCTSAYVTAPVCSPSRAGLLTGRYQNRFGFEFLVNDDSIVLPGKQVGLDPGETTIAYQMNRLGYATGCVGKWHLGKEEPFFPTERGFDEFYGTLGQSGHYEPVLYDSRQGRKGKKIRTEGYYTTDDFSRRAVEFIHDHRQEPFFLYLAHFAVHTPHVAPEHYLSRFPNVSDPERKTYLAMLSAMDDGVGKVLAALQETGLEENTMVIFLSDNGGTKGSSNKPLEGRKGNTWEGGIRTPFLVQWKGKLQPGTEFDGMISSLDILPTSIAAAGGKIDPNWELDGVNILPYLTGERQGDPHEVLFWRFGTQWAVRSQDWKLLQAREASGGTIQIANTGPVRLFNLDEDIGEENDLTAKNPEKAEELRRLWEAWAAELPEPSWQPKPLEVGTD